MRQSRAIELARDYPAHVATAWLGHSAQVAMRHYWRVTEADFEKAVGGKSGVEGGQQAGQVNVWQGSDCGTKCGTASVGNGKRRTADFDANPYRFPSYAKLFRSF